MTRFLFALIALGAITATLAQDTARLNYADFEQLDKDKRLQSSRGGKLFFNSFAQNGANAAKPLPKLLGPQAPLTQRLGFEYEIAAPNAWAEASVKILGLKDKGFLDDEAKTLLVKAEDMSQYSQLSLDIGATGTTQVRVRLVSEGNGVDTGGAFPEQMLTLTNELKNYRLPLSGFAQPTGDWVKKKVKTEQVIKKLTAIQISVLQVPSRGFVVIDNVAFEK